MKMPDRGRREDIWRTQKHEERLVATERFARAHQKASVVGVADEEVFRGVVERDLGESVDSTDGEEGCEQEDEAGTADDELSGEVHRLAEETFSCEQPVWQTGRALYGAPVQAERSWPWAAPWLLTRLPDN